MRLATWAWSACLTSCMIGSSGLAWLHRQKSTLGSVICVLPSKPGSQGPPQKHHGHISSGAGLPWLSVPGTWEGPGWECSGGHRPFHQVHPGVCNHNPNCPDDCQNPVGQVHCPLWVAWKDPNGSRLKFWWLTSVSWWGCRRFRLIHTTCKPMASVKGSIPLWSTCLGHSPTKRSQSGRTTLEHWFMHKIAPKIPLQGSAPTTSCLGDNLAFQ